MNDELARFVVQQVGISRLRASEGLFYAVESAYCLVPANRVDQYYSSAGVWEWKRGRYQTFGSFIFSGLSAKLHRMDGVSSCGEFGQSSYYSR